MSTLLYVDDWNTKWISTEYELTEFNGINWTVYNAFNSGLPENGVSALTFDETGTKWIGSIGEGLIRFDGTNWTPINTSNSGLSDESIKTIAIDTAGTKWIGTNLGGLVEFDGTNWINL